MPSTTTAMTTAKIGAVLFFFFPALFVPEEDFFAGDFFDVERVEEAEVLLFFMVEGLLPEPAPDEESTDLTPGRTRPVFLLFPFPVFFIIQAP